MIQISTVRDGAIVMFPNSAYYWIKVCGRDGIGGVVNLAKGLYIPVRDLNKNGLGEKVTVVAKNLDDLLFEDEEE